MRVKGSTVRRLMWSRWSTDTYPPPSTTCQHETMLYERGSPFTLITAVTWQAVGCPSLLNIYVSTRVLPWWLSRLWHMLFLLSSSSSVLIPLSFSISIKAQQNDRKTLIKHKCCLVVFVTASSQKKRCFVFQMYIGFIWSIHFKQTVLMIVNNIFSIVDSWMLWGFLTKVVPLN